MSDNNQIILASLNGLLQIANQNTQVQLAKYKYDEQIQASKDAATLAHKRSLHRMNLGEKINTVQADYNQQIKEIDVLANSLNNLDALNVEHLKTIAGRKEFTVDGKNILDNITTTTSQDLRTSLGETDQTLGALGQLNQSMEENSMVLHILREVEKEANIGVAFMDRHVDKLGLDYDIMSDEFRESDVAKAFMTEFTDDYPTEIDPVTGEQTFVTKFNPAFHAAMNSIPDLDAKIKFQKVLNGMKEHGIIIQQRETKSVYDKIKAGEEGFDLLNSHASDFIFKNIKTEFSDKYGADDEKFAKWQASVYLEDSRMVNAGFGRLHNIAEYLKNSPEALKMFSSVEDLETFKKKIEDNIFNLTGYASDEGGTNEAVTKMIYGDDWKTEKAVGGPGSNIHALIKYFVAPTDENGNYTETWQDAHPSESTDSLTTTSDVEALALSAFDKFKPLGVVSAAAPDNKSNVGKEGYNLASEYWGYEGMRAWDEKTKSWVHENIGDFVSGGGRYWEQNREGQEYLVDLGNLYLYVDKLIDFKNQTEIDYDAEDREREIYINNEARRNLGFEYQGDGHVMGRHYLNYAIGKFDEEKEKLEKTHGIDTSTKEGIYDLDSMLLEWNKEPNLLDPNTAAIDVLNMIDEVLSNVDKPEALNQIETLINDMLATPRGQDQQQLQTILNALQEQGYNEDEMQEVFNTLKEIKGSSELNEYIKTLGRSGGGGGGAG